MRTPQSINEKFLQLGRIAEMELFLIKRDKKRNWKYQPMKRTAKASEKLRQYITNVIGYMPDASIQHFDKDIIAAYKKKYTAAQFQGKA